MTQAREKALRLSWENGGAGWLLREEVQRHRKRFVLHGTEVWQALRCRMFFRCYIISIGDKAGTPPADAQ